MKHLVGSNTVSFYSDTGYTVEDFGGENFRQDAQLTLLIMVSFLENSIHKAILTAKNF